MLQIFDKGSVFTIDTHEQSGMYFIRQGEVQLLLSMNNKSKNQVEKWKTFQEDQVLFFPIIPSLKVQAKSVSYSILFLQKTKIDFFPITQLEDLKSFVQTQILGNVGLLEKIWKSFQSLLQDYEEYMEESRQLVQVYRSSLGMLGILEEKGYINSTDIPGKQDILEYLENTSQTQLFLPAQEHTFQVHFDGFEPNEDGFMPIRIFFKEWRSVYKILVTNLNRENAFSISYFLLEMVARGMDYLFFRLEHRYLYIEEILKHLFVDKGVLPTLFQAMETQQDARMIKNISYFPKRTLQLLEKYKSPQHVFLKHFGHSIHAEWDRWDMKYKQMGALKKAQGDETPAESIIDSWNKYPQYKNSLQTILQYSNLDSEAKTSFLSLYQQWIAEKNLLSTEPHMRDLRKRITEQYWQIYKSCLTQYAYAYLVYLQQKRNKVETKMPELPTPVKSLLLYGFLDENLVHSSVVISLEISRKLMIEKQQPNSPLFFLDWILLMVQKKYQPSIDSFGETYEKYLNQQNEELAKQYKKVAPEDIPKVKDDYQRRITYEIDKITKDAAKMCNGDIYTYIPILLQDNLPNQVKNIPTALHFFRGFQAVKEIDFSAFYREIRYVDSEKGIEEFIQSEIIPDFILLPIVGSSSVVWQVKEKKRDSKGRVFLPVGMTETSDEAVFHFFKNIFGIYRWEILKELLGLLWSDVSQNTLTGHYIDYLISYQKDSRISIETRQKLSQLYRSIQTDRERFLHDYSIWLTKESSGRPVLNKALRYIFYQFVPFSKKIREKLQNMPQYAPMEKKFQNTRRKDLEKLDVKIQKYEKRGIPIPKPIQEYYQFLKES